MSVNWNRKKYTKEDLVAAVEESFSWRGVARQLGLDPNAGGVYYGIKTAVADLELNHDHFTGQAWNKGDIFGLNRRFVKIPTNEILVKNSTYLNTTNLKRRLIAEGLVESKCSAPFCPVPDPTINPFTGESKELKLSLDHIDGDRTNNLIENLRLLCYHCHGETDTWCRKNKVKYDPSTGRPFGEPVALGATSRNNSVAGSIPVLCTTCGVPISKEATRCIYCYIESTRGVPRPHKNKIVWPDIEDLLLMLNSSNYSAVGRKLGVSDNAVRKHVKMVQSVSGSNPVTGTKQ